MKSFERVELFSVMTVARFASEVVYKNTDMSEEKSAVNCICESEGQEVRGRPPWGGETRFLINFGSFSSMSEAPGRTCPDWPLCCPIRVRTGPGHSRSCDLVKKPSAYQLLS